MLKQTPQKAKWKTKNGTKNKGNKLKSWTNIVDTNPILLIAPLHISGLNVPTKRQRLWK
jgi:hypothetical protein